MSLQKSNNLRSQLRLPALVSLLTLLANPVSAAAVLQWQQQALGASLQLELQGVSAAEFAAAQPKLQLKLTALLQQLDPNNRNSALSQLNHQGIMPATDSTLLRLLRRCEQWYQLHGGYSCRLGSIHQQWQRAQTQGQLPDRVALRQQTRLLQRSKPAEVLQNRQIYWDFHGLNQAFLVDQVRLWCEELFPHFTSLRLQLGDVLLAHGTEKGTAKGTAATVTLPWQITHPASAALLDINLTQAALAYSQQQGGYQLSYRHYSPLLNPADGWPVEYGPQVAAVAHTAIDAWLLAQSLAVLPMDKHPQLLTATKGKLPAAALLNITTASSTVLQPSAQWFSWLADQQQWQPQASLHLQYQIRQQQAAAKRPYLAIWVSTKDLQLVRQLSLQGQQARWYQELRQWWRRIGKPAQLPLDSLAGATRKAGAYQLDWDGRDEHGRPVPPGEYVLHLEIAREQGEHEKLSLPLQFQTGAVGRSSGRLELGAIKWQVKTALTAQTITAAGTASAVASVIKP